jgi:hypothetical protein
MIDETSTVAEVIFQTFPSAIAYIGHIIPHHYLPGSPTPRKEISSR